MWRISAADSKTRAVVGLERRRAAERVEGEVLGRLLRLARHHGEVERLAELLEQPEDAGRAGAGLVVEAHGAILVRDPSLGSSR